MTLLLYVCEEEVVAIGDEISFRKLDRLLTPSLAKPP